MYICLFSNRAFFFFGSWFLRVLYTSWILTPYQKIDLQIFSLILRAIQFYPFTKYVCVCKQCVELFCMHWNFILSDCKPCSVTCCFPPALGFWSTSMLIDSIRCHCCVCTAWHLCVHFPVDEYLGGFHFLTIIVCLYKSFLFICPSAHVGGSLGWQPAGVWVRGSASSEPFSGVWDGSCSPSSTQKSPLPHPPTSIDLLSLHISH